ncbi:MAG: Polysaccharide biosynthesis protein [Chthonomonadales bacterium]|nr:Polysaccharide biosynthesis protein [Chthonomonadales bacterium]
MSRSHRAARNVIVTLVTQLLMWSLSFSVTLFVPGYLKDTGLGTLTLVGSFAALFAILVTLGTSQVVVKEIARDHSRLSELIWASLMMRTVLGLGAILIGWLVSFLLGYSHELQRLIVIALCVMVLGGVAEVLSNALGGLEEFPKQNACSLAERVIAGVVTIGLVVFHQPLWKFVAVGLVSNSVLLISNLYMLRGHLTRISLPQWSTIRTLSRSGVPFLMVGVFGAIYGQCDPLILAKISGVAAIGWYGLAKRLGGTTMVIPTALTVTTLPTLSRMYKEDQDSFRKAIRRLFNLMVICVIPIAAVLILAPGQILSFLHYPASYRHSIPVFMLMGSALILWFLSQAVGTALIASDRQAVFSRITGIAAVAAIPLCTLCIFVTERTMANGAVGAMFADASLELFIVIAYMRALPEGIFEWRLFSLMGRTAIAALPFALSLYLMRSGRDVLLPLAGLVLYAVACFWLRCLTPQDLNAVRQSLSRFSRARA